MLIAWHDANKGVALIRLICGIRVRTKTTEYFLVLNMDSTCSVLMFFEHGFHGFHGWHLFGAWVFEHGLHG